MTSLSCYSSICVIVLRPSSILLVMHVSCQRKLLSKYYLLIAGIYYRDSNNKLHDQVVSCDDAVNFSCQLILRLSIVTRSKWWFLNYKASFLCSSSILSLCFYPFAIVVDIPTPSSLENNVKKHALMVSRGLSGVYVFYMFLPFLLPTKPRGMFLSIALPHPLKSRIKKTPF